MPPMQCPMTTIQLKMELAKSSSIVAIQGREVQQNACMICNVIVAFDHL